MFDHLRAWLGRQEQVCDVVTVDLVRRFNATLDQSTDVPADGDIAPLLLHFCLGQLMEPTGQLGEDGHPKKVGFLPPVPLPRRMWAGGSLAFFDDLRVGDGVRRVSRIVDVAVKEGRSGTLCFVIIDHQYDVNDLAVIEERQEIVYRKPSFCGPVSKPASPEEPIAPGNHSRAVSLSAPLLFRYSALMLNGHRIHYDRAYACDIEFYPGLVVHGPLQATLLLHFARELKARPPKTFSFRAESPLFEDDRISMHAVEDDGKMSRRTMRDGGPIAMRAEASWDDCT